MALVNLIYVGFLQNLAPPFFVYSSCFEGLKTFEPQKITLSIKNLLFSLLNECKDAYVEANPEIDDDELQKSKNLKLTSQPFV